MSSAGVDRRRRAVEDSRALQVPAYPALAPSLLGAGIALVTLLLGFFWLFETRAAKPAGYVIAGSEDKAVEEAVEPAPSSLRSRPFITSVLLRFCLGGVSFASFDAIPLWAIATASAGGLDALGQVVVPLAEIVDNDACIEDRLLPQPANFGAKRRLARRFDEGLLLEVELVDVQR